MISWLVLIFTIFFPVIPVKISAFLLIKELCLRLHDVLGDSQKISITDSVAPLSNEVIYLFIYLFIRPWFHTVTT